MIYYKWNKLAHGQRRNYRVQKILNGIFDLDCELTLIRHSKSKESNLRSRILSSRATKFDTIAIVNDPVIKEWIWFRKFLGEGEEFLREGEKFYWYIKICIKYPKYSNLKF